MISSSPAEAGPFVRIKVSSSGSTDALRMVRPKVSSIVAIQFIVGLASDEYRMWRTLRNRLPITGLSAWIVSATARLPLLAATVFLPLVIGLFYQFDRFFGLLVLRGSELCDVFKLHVAQVGSHLVYRVSGAAPRQDQFADGLFAHAQQIGDLPLPCAQWHQSQRIDPAERIMRIGVQV